MSNSKHMNIRLNPNHTALLRSSNDEHDEVVRCAFYLGYGVNFIHELINNPIRKRERESIVAQAHILGITQEDIYVKSTTNLPRPDDPVTSDKVLWRPRS